MTDLSDVRWMCQVWMPIVRSEDVPWPPDLGLDRSRSWRTPEIPGERRKQKTKAKAARKNAKVSRRRNR